MQNSTEEWRPIPGFPGYEASTLGRIRSFRRGKPYVMSSKLTNPRWYVLLQLRRDGQTVPMRTHHLVARTFIGPRPRGMVVCHNDGDRRNNRTENLRYDTPAGNHRDVAIHALGFTYQDWRHFLAAVDQAKTPASPVPVEPGYRPVWDWEYATGGPGLVRATEFERRRARKIRAWRALGLTYPQIVERCGGGITVSGVCRICCGNRLADA